MEGVYHGLRPSKIHLKLKDKPNMKYFSEDKTKISTLELRHSGGRLPREYGHNVPGPRPGSDYPPSTPPWLHPPSQIPLEPISQPVWGGTRANSLENGGGRGGG